MSTATTRTIKVSIVTFRSLAIGGPPAESLTRGEVAEHQDEEGDGSDEVEQVNHGAPPSAIRCSGMLYSTSTGMKKG